MVKFWHLTVSFFVVGVLAMAVEAAEKFTFRDHIEPIFSQACNNCHNPDKKKGDLDLTSYAKTMIGGSGGKIVVAGDSGASSLFGAISHTFGKEMPPEGDKLSAKEINVVRAWIDGGLLETDKSKPKLTESTAIKIIAPTGGKPDGPPPMPEDILMESVHSIVRPPAVTTMAASPWAPLVAIGGEKQIAFFHTDTLELLSVLPIGKTVTSISFDQSGRYLLVGAGIAGKEGTAYIYEVKTGSKLAKAGKLYDTPQAATFTADLSKVALGGAARLIKVWDVQSREQLFNKKKHTDWITAMRYSPDGILLASADRNGGLWIWETESGEEFYTLRGHQKRITALKWSADSNYLLSASEDGNYRIWKMYDGKEVKRVTAHGGGILDADWGRNGVIATVGRDKRVKLWKSSFSLLRDLGPQKTLPTSVAVSYDGKRVIVGYLDSMPSVWDIKSFKKIGELDVNPPSVDKQIADLGGKKLPAEQHKKMRHRLMLAQLNAARLKAAEEASKLKLKYRETRYKFSQAAKQLRNIKEGDSYLRKSAELQLLKRKLNNFYPFLQRAEFHADATARDYEKVRKVMDL